MRHPATAFRALLTTPAVLALVAPVVLAQGIDLDRGRFEIRAEGVVVGEETFRIRRLPLPDGTGFSIQTTASFPPDATPTTTAVIELSPDSLPITVQLDAGPSRRVIARLGERRVTVRTVSPGGETAREYPASKRAIVVDDSLFAPYAVLPGITPGTVVLFSPRDGARTSGSLAAAGSASVHVAGHVMTLQHYVLRTPSVAIDLWFDDSGRLMKVTNAPGGLAAERAPASQ